jgi:serine/threonine protein kinase
VSCGIELIDDGGDEGACVKRPNLCIVTEFAKNGSLHTILHDPSMRLPWHQRLRMLRDAALGVHYLHSLSPCIVHRDLKPANLLVRHHSLLTAYAHALPHARTSLTKVVATGGRELEREGGRLRVRAHQGGERHHDPVRHALLDR